MPLYNNKMEAMAPMTLASSHKHCTKALLQKDSTIRHVGRWGVHINEHVYRSRGEGEEIWNF